MSEVQEGPRWASGFHPPRGVSPEAFAGRLRKLKEPTPEASFEASKRKTDLLHEATWGEGDQVWANRARLEFHRKCISSLVEPVFVGGKSIEVRAVEFVRVNGEGRWAHIDDIRADPELYDAYFDAVERLQEQALAKMAKLRELRPGG